jgi:anti-sigma factor RsiW
MTGADQCPQIRQELGVYLLGTIEPARRTVVARHLATCPECRAELAGLAGLPALLGRVPADELRPLPEDDATAPVPGPPLGALLGRVARTRRRRRYLAVAAALIVGAAGVFGWQALRPAGPPGAGAACSRSVTADQAADGERHADGQRAESQLAQARPRHGPAGQPAHGHPARHQGHRRDP